MFRKLFRRAWSNDDELSNIFTCLVHFYSFYPIKCTDLWKKKKKFTDLCYSSPQGIMSNGIVYPGKEGSHYSSILFSFCFSPFKWSKNPLFTMSWATTEDRFEFDCSFSLSCVYWPYNVSLTNCNELRFTLENLTYVATIILFCMYFVNRRS